MILELIEEKERTCVIPAVFLLLLPAGQEVSDPSQWRKASVEKVDSVTLLKSVVS